MNAARLGLSVLTAASLTVGAALLLQPHAGTAKPSASGEPYGLSTSQWRDVAPFGTARLTGQGLIEIREPGSSETYTVHADSRAVASEPSTGTQTSTNPTRNPVCSQTATDYRMVVLYAHPADKSSRYTASVDRIRTLVKEMDYKLYSDAVASGGATKGADYRVECYAGTSSIRVAELHSTTTSDKDLFGQIKLDAKNAGFNKANEKYLIWYDDVRPEYCGLGDLYADDRKVADNASNGAVAEYAVVYGDPCWTRNTGMHEIGHTMGAVQNGAPHSSGGGHCNDGSDIMCYSDGGSTSHYTATACTTTRPFDCGYDDYFDTSTEAGEWLATHWNIGWPGNRFLVFGR